MLGHEQIQELQKKLDEAVTFVKKNGLTGTSQAALETSLARLQEFKKQIGAFSADTLQKLVEMYKQVLHQVLSLAPVQRALESAQPLAEKAWSKYMSAHNVVAASPTYHRVVDLSSGVLSQVQGTRLYKAASNNVYPYVSAYVDPALDKVTHSPQYAAVVDHLKPLPTSTGAQAPAASE